MNTTNQNPQPVTEAPTCVDAGVILQEYERRQLLTAMTGPLASLACHIVILALVATLFTGKQREVQEGFVVISQPPVVIVPKPIPPDIMDKIDATEDQIQAPTTDKPELPESAPQETGAPEEVLGSPSEDPVPGITEIGMLPVEDFDGPTLLVIDYTPRTPLGRKKGIEIGGGNPEGQAAVLHALRWLASVQEANGSWADNPAHTGMALLTFLAHGELPMSEEFGATVQKAMQWLAGAMLNLPGDGICGGRAYSHAIAAYALAEGAGMTHIPILRTAMDKGVARIVAGQQDRGGFDYEYRKGERWDLSVSGWQFQALKAAYVARCTVPGIGEAIDKAARFMRREAFANGRFGYCAPGSGGNMTGVGAACLQILGYGDSKETRAACETISKERLALYQAIQAAPHTFGAQAGNAIYGWYYDTQAMFNLGTKSRPWREWGPVFQAVLTRAQDPAGYWEVQQGPGMDPTLPGRVLSTTWCCLQLEVFYRTLPTFNIKAMDEHRTVAARTEVAEAMGDSGLKIYTMPE